MTTRVAPRQILGRSGAVPPALDRTYQRGRPSLGVGTHLRDRLSGRVVPGSVADLSSSLTSTARASPQLGAPNALEQARRPVAGDRIAARLDLPTPNLRIV